MRSIVFDISRRNVWPAPFNGRCLRNAHTERWLGRELELMHNAEVESARYMAARQAQDFDIAAVIAGEAAGLIRDVQPAARIVAGMVEQAEGLLARRGHEPAGVQVRARRVPEPSAQREGSPVSRDQVEENTARTSVGCRVSNRSWQPMQRSAAGCAFSRASGMSLPQSAQTP